MAKTYKYTDAQGNICELNHELPEGAKLIKQVPLTPTVGKNRGIPRPSGWVIYSLDGQRTYRYDGRKEVVDHIVMEGKGVQRLQISGSHPAYSVSELFPIGKEKYDAYISQFRAFEDDFYRPTGWWENKVNFFYFRQPGTPKWDRVNKVDKEYFTKYMPNTYKP